MVEAEGRLDRKPQPDEELVVVALVGAAGTGKSHKAQAIAQELEADAVIDDGLLICGSRIVAGHSSKREESRSAAVKRAIFSDPVHALEVRQALSELGPKRVLVLGTSKAMVERICIRLGLPAPSRYLDIAELSTPEEITRALLARKTEGKHVIPAPTFEVKKTFSGYLVDPVEMFILSRGKKPVYVQKSVVRPTWSSYGKFFISDSVLMAIAARACREVEGVVKQPRVLVLPTPEGAIVDVEIVVSYPHRPFEVMAEVQSKVKESLEYLTGIFVYRVDITTRKMSL